MLSFVSFQGTRAQAPADSIDFSFLSSMSHPRLLMSHDDFAKPSMADTGSMLGRMNTLVLRRAEKCLREDRAVEYKLDASGKRLLGQSRLALEKLFYFSYAFRVSGREEFCDRALEVLRIVCAFPDWHPSHFLDVGEMALGVAIAYDWLYDHLSQEERASVEKCLIEYAMKPSDRQWWHGSEGNWNQVCNCGLAAAAIATYESSPQLCEKILNTAVKDNIFANSGIYGPDGNYPEGYNYWSYGTGFEVLLIAMLEHACGSDFGLSDTPGFMQTAEYMLFMAGATGIPFSYVDGGRDTEQPKAAMWWFAAKTGEASLLMNEWRLLDEGRYLSGEDRRLLPMIPCFIKDRGFAWRKTPDDISKPEREIWYGRGVVPVGMIHTGWNFDATDVYLGVKGGKAAHNHGHMDAGSFVFDAQGVRWSEDQAQLNYASMENALSKEDGDFWDMWQYSLRWDIFRMNNLAHSTLSFFSPDGSVDDKLHPSDHIVGGSVTLEEVYEEKPYGFRLDMTAAVADQVDTALRTFRVVEGALYVIDEVRAKPGQDAVMQWRMLTLASVEVSDKGETLTRDGKTLYLSSSNTASLPVEYQVWEAARPDDWVPRDWDPDDSGYCVAGYCVTIPAGTTAVFTTLLAADECAKASLQVLE